MMLQLSSYKNQQVILSDEKNCPCMYHGWQKYDTLFLHFDSSIPEMRLICLIKHMHAADSSF